MHIFDGYADIFLPIWNEMLALRDALTFMHLSPDVHSLGRDIVVTDLYSKLLPPCTYITMCSKLKALHVYSNSPMVLHAWCIAINIPPDKDMKSRTLAALLSAEISLDHMYTSGDM